MLQPARTKYRKAHRDRGQIKKMRATKGTMLAHGLYGLKCQSIGELTSREIEASRRAIMHHLQRGGKMWIRIFPHKPITKKSPEVPMGSGKGAVEFYACPVWPGTMLFELDGIDETAAREAFRLGAHKLSVRTKFVKRIQTT